jgi:hypothetical protein
MINKRFSLTPQNDNYDKLAAFLSSSPVLLELARGYFNTAFSVVQKPRPIIVE